MNANHVERGPAQRPRSSDELFRTLRDAYGIRNDGETRGLGGSSTLNPLVEDDARKVVVRVYRPWLTAERLAAMQAAMT